MGWFYGMKVHVIINHHGEIVTFYISSGNVADNNEQVIFRLTKKLLENYLAIKVIWLIQNVFMKLYERGVHLITKIRENMRNKLWI